MSVRFVTQLSRRICRRRTSDARPAKTPSIQSVSTDGSRVVTRTHARYAEITSFSFRDILRKDSFLSIIEIDFDSTWRVFYGGLGIVHRLYRFNTCIHPFIYYASVALPYGTSMINLCRGHFIILIQKLIN